MNLSLSEELHLFSQELQHFLSPIVLQEIVKQVGFVQRSSKYQADELIAICVWLSQEIASTSLTQLCSRLEASTGVLITRTVRARRLACSRLGGPVRQADRGADESANIVLRSGVDLRG